MKNLPINIIIPLSKSREEFFEGFCLPSIFSNYITFENIIIEDGADNVQAKRNRGASKATQPYIFFCDDDVILKQDCLEKMFNMLDTFKEYGFCYSDYLGIPLTPDAHPTRIPFVHKAKEFDFNILKKTNYVSTMSLIRRECFTEFDEGCKRLQDWDLFLGMALKGVTGKYIPEILFHAYYLEKGITNGSTSWQDAVIHIKKKYNI